MRGWKTRLDYRFADVFFIEGFVFEFLVDGFSCDLCFFFRNNIREGLIYSMGRVLVRESRGLGSNFRFVMNVLGVFIWYIF